MFTTATFASPLGPLRLSEENGRLIRLDYHRDPLSESYEPTPVLVEAMSQLTAYFQGKLKKFDLPLEMRGTPFQRQVWRQLLTIPYGETRSYGQIADAIGKPGASRAVGGANNKNPLAIIVPCHRVIGSDGSLVGYASGVDIKQKLLQLEQTNY